MSFYAHFTSFKDIYDGHLLNEQCILLDLLDNPQRSFFIAVIGTHNRPLWFSCKNEMEIVASLAKVKFPCPSQSEKSDMAVQMYAKGCPV